MKLKAFTALFLLTLSPCVTLAAAKPSGRAQGSVTYANRVSTSSKRPVTVESLKRLLDRLDLKYRVSGGNIFLTFETDTYIDKEGDKSLLLVISLSENGEYLTISAPYAFDASGSNSEAVLKACLSIQWKTKLIQFEYDDLDGELRPTVEFPLEDSNLTSKQLGRCISGLVELVDTSYLTIKEAQETGEFTFPPVRSPEEPDDESDEEPAQASPKA